MSRIKSKESRPLPSHGRRSEMIKALRAAFPHTIPILTGFLFLGISCGIYMTGSGFPFWYPIISSLFVFAGSMEFVLVSLLLGVFDPLSAIMMTLMINARHLFYGLSMLERYRHTGGLKPYLIFGLCDESFSINCTTKAPKGVDEGYFMFFVTLLDQSYWVIGSALGGVLGSLISFDLDGIDFVMTAMFTVILLEQLLSHKNRICEIAGLAISVACLLLFGADRFIIPSMAAILVFLTAAKKKVGSLPDYSGADREEAKK